MKKGFNKSDVERNAFQLFGAQAKKGYDWWWHSFTAKDAKTGEEKAFFVEFFLCNPEYGEAKPVLGQDPKSIREDKKPSYLMVKMGCWGEDKVQLNRYFGWEDVELTVRAPFFIKADDCVITENRLQARVKITDKEAKANPEWMSDAGEMAMDLRIDKQVAFNVGYGAGELFRRLQLFEMFWHAEGMKTAYRGKVVYNGRKYIVSPESSYGYADKNWGKDFTSPWVWLSSNNLKSTISGKTLTDSVFDIGGGRPKIGPVALNRKLLSAFWYEGTPYEFNFSKFWTFCRTKFDCTETEEQIVWHVEQKTLTDKMVTDITCDKKDMLLINYEAPDGKKRHNHLYNGGNGRGDIELYHCGRLVDRIHAENVGCEFGEYDKRRI